METPLTKSNEIETKNGRLIKRRSHASSSSQFLHPMLDALSSSLTLEPGILVVDFFWPSSKSANKLTVGKHYKLFPPLFNILILSQTKICPSQFIFYFGLSHIQPYSSHIDCQHLCSSTQYLCHHIPVELRVFPVGRNLPKSTTSLLTKMISLRNVFLEFDRWKSGRIFAIDCTEPFAFFASHTPWFLLSYNAIKF